MVAGRADGGGIVLACNSRESSGRVVQRELSSEDLFGGWPFLHSLDPSQWTTSTISRSDALPCFALAFRRWSGLWRDNDMMKLEIQDGTSWMDQIYS